MRLVGRDPELGEITRAVAAVAAGESRTIGVFGEAGIGKSALLEAAAAAAGEAGLQVLSGRAAEHEREVPFSLVVDALDERVAAMNPARVAAVGTELGQVLPAAADGSPPLDAAGPAERFRYHRALRALLELLGRERPFALLLDDLHWADEASLELVLHLLRRTPQVPHLLVFGLRPLEPAARLIDAARSAPGWIELRPMPLAAAEARALLPADLGPALSARMVGEAGGNPLLLRELGRLGADPAGQLPSTVLAAVRREVSGLPSAAAALLGGAAVAGDPFDLDLAVAAADTPAAEAPWALDLLVAADLVHPLGRGRSFRFRHPLVRRAVYEGIPAGTRLAAHRRAAAALAARGAVPALRAHHFECFAGPGDEEAIEIFVAAAVAAADTSPAAAAHWYATALELLPHEDPRRAALLPPLGRALASAGRLAESFEALEAAIGLLPGEAAAERAELVRLLATIAVLLGAYDRAEAELDRELRIAPPAERPALFLLRASTAFFNGEMEEIGEWADRAAAELDPAEQPAVQVQLDATIAIGRLWRGEPAATCSKRRGSASIASTTPSWPRCRRRSGRSAATSSRPSSSTPRRRCCGGGSRSCGGAAPTTW
jgi:predicted ATPase